jgi:hypothetical protein
MNEAAQASIIFTERHGASELRLEVAAAVATAVAHQQLRAGEAVAAKYALWRAYRLNGLKTFGANRDPGDVVERSAAESAIRGEKDGKNVSQQGLQGRDEDGTLLGALLSSFSL